MYKLLSYVQLFALCTTVMYFALCTTTVMYNSWIVACQDLISMEFSRQKYWSGLPFPSPRDLPDSGIEPSSPALQVNSLPSEPPGKPMNTGVGSLSHLQEIFPTQELNQDLLHCRQILYQLSYQGSGKVLYL